MNRTLAVVLVVLVAGVVIASFVILPLHYFSANGSSSVNVPSSVLTVKTSGNPQVNVTVSAVWSSLSTQSPTASSLYYVLEVYITIENNRTVAIHAPFLPYTSFRITPLDGINYTIWRSYQFYGSDGYLYLPDLNPGQKAQIVDQIFFLPSQSDGPNLSSVNSAISVYMQQNSPQYSYLGWHSSALVPDSGVTFTYSLVNGSGMNPQVDMFGTYYNISDNIVL